VNAIFAEQLAAWLMNALATEAAGQTKTFAFPAFPLDVYHQNGKFR